MKNSPANKRQVGGNHYKLDGSGEEHWDRVHRLGLDYYQACITKYVERAWLKNGVEDLKKAHHFLQKYIELKTAEQAAIDPADPDRRYVCQDPELLSEGPAS